ncbi:hypothetical protein [Streptomyces sp. NPDC057257]|uniref:hypothetical protein n=1 Tax=Streptomyces sp. NPDC057257 TaxID=3346071 RepID=UPI0036400E57
MRKKPISDETLARIRRSLTVSEAAALAHPGLRTADYVAQKIAEHPDLAGLDAQLNRFYGAGPVRPDEEPTR